MRNEFRASRPRLKRLSQKARGNGAGNGLHFVDSEAGLLKASPERRKGKEPRVGQVENTSFAVVELTQQVHEPWDDEADIRRTD
jgi:hypothetical protein